MTNYTQNLFEENKYLKKVIFWLEVGLVTSWLLFITYVLTHA